MMKIQSLDDRRRTLCLKFAKNCLRNEKVKNMFPLTKGITELKQERRISSKYSNQIQKDMTNLQYPT